MTLSYLASPVNPTNQTHLMKFSDLLVDDDNKCNSIPLCLGLLLHHHQNQLLAPV